MVIVPIVVSSKVCSLHTERAREEEMTKVYLSQVRTVCRSELFVFIHRALTGFVHRAAKRDLFRVKRMNGVRRARAKSPQARRAVYPICC